MIKQSTKGADRECYQSLIYYSESITDNCTAQPGGKWHWHLCRPYCTQENAYFPFDQRNTQWISFPWRCAVPHPVYKKRWHGPNLQRAGSHCDAGGCRWGQQRCWKECIRVPYYSAQSGKPAGVKTLWSYTSRGRELEQACICSRTHCVISLIKSLTGGVPVVWPLWAWWSFQCLEVQIAHKEWADTLLPGSFSLPLSEEGSAPG